MTDNSKIHHLAIGVVFIVAGHMYEANGGIGHDAKDIFNPQKQPSGKMGERYHLLPIYHYGWRFVHKGLFETITNLLHVQFGPALDALGAITYLLAKHMQAFPTHSTCISISTEI